MGKASWLDAAATVATAPAHKNRLLSLRSPTIDDEGDGERGLLLATEHMSLYLARHCREAHKLNCRLLSVLVAEAALDEIDEDFDFGRQELSMGIDDIDRHLAASIFFHDGNQQTRIDFIDTIVVRQSGNSDT